MDGIKQQQTLKIYKNFYPFIDIANKYILSINE